MLLYIHFFHTERCSTQFSFFHPLLHSDIFCLWPKLKHCWKCTTVHHSLSQVAFAMTFLCFQVIDLLVCCFVSKMRCACIASVLVCCENVHRSNEGHIYDQVCFAKVVCDHQVCAILLSSVVFCFHQFVITNLWRRLCKLLKSLASGSVKIKIVAGCGIASMFLVLCCLGPALCIGAYIIIICLLPFCSLSSTSSCVKFCAALVSSISSSWRLATSEMLLICCDSASCWVRTWSAELAPVD